MSGFVKNVVTRQLLAAENGSSLVGYSSTDGGALTNLKTKLRLLESDTGAALIGNTPSGAITATTVQGAINELEALATTAPTEVISLFEPSDIQTGSMTPSQAIDFYDYFPNTLPPNVGKFGTATATINAARQLEVSCVYSVDANKVVLNGFSFSEGILRFAVVKGPFMVRLTMPDGSCRAVWSADGANIEVGTLTAANVITSLKTVTCAGSGSDIVWVDLITGPASGSGGFNIRSWVHGTTRPGIGAGAALWGATALGKNAGVISVCSITAAVAKFVAFQVLDVPKVTSQATFIGRWFSRFDGKNAMTTIRGGDSFRFRVTGTTKVAVRLLLPDGNPAVTMPVGDIYVNNTYSHTATFTGGTEFDLLTGLTESSIYYVEVRVRGVNESNPKWLKGDGLMVESLDAYSHIYPGARISPWKDNRSKILFVGDSITEGIVARGSPSLPTNSAGDLCWPVLVSKMRGLSPVMNGFGGTRLTGPSTGSGGVVEAAINAFFYMDGRPIDTLKEGIEFVVVNLGTNDAGAGVAAATFEAAMKAFLSNILRKFPSIQKVWVMRPFGGYYAANISAAVAAMGDPRFSYVDTSAWIGVTFTDGTHPDLAGHAAIAAQLSAVMNNMQSASIAL